MEDSVSSDLGGSAQDRSALVVDDDSMMRDLLKHMLNELGFSNTRFEEDPANVLHAVRESNPHLILLDLHLRGSDGITVAQTLTEHDPGWKDRALLFVTGDAVGPELQEALQIGTRDVLQKPFTVGELDDKLENLLRRDRPPPTGAGRPGRDTSQRGATKRPAGGSATDRRRADLEDRAEGMEPEISRRFAELEEANRKLEAANVAKSEFLSRVSHELRTPLTSILGFGELLTMSELATEQDEWVELILTAGRHLLALLDDVLDIARIESGQMSLSVEPVPIDTVVSDAVELARPLARARGITLSSRPRDSRHGYMTGDYQRLRQVLLNLLSNGIKYNRRGGSVTIAVEDRPADFVRVAVTDTGPGLSEEELGRLFVPFERLTAPMKGVEGTGLGLVLSRNLTESMGGEIGVGSEPGAGSTFWIELPGIEPHSVEDLRPELDTIVQPRRYSRPRRIVYVEDMLANVKLVEQILRRRPDVSVVPAMLGIVAVDLIRTGRPDLVLLDLHLPDMDGIEVLRRLKTDESTRSIPVMILSADATPRRRDELLAEGATEYLTKPIGVKYLLDAIDQLLGEDAR